MTTFVLRPIHAWFFLWEALVPSVYRVVATGLGSLITAVLLAAAGMYPLLAVGVALPLWIVLAVVQEHDERVTLPPDPEFLAALTEALAASSLGLGVEHAHGPSRARRGTSHWFYLSTNDVVSGAPGGASAHVSRDTSEGWMQVQLHDADFVQQSFEQRLGERGRPDLADRVQEVRIAESDARAVVEALEVVLR